MRVALVPSTLFAFGLAACTAPVREPDRTDDAAPVEATWHVARTEAQPHVPEQLDDVAEQLLRAATEALDLRRRVALENLSNTHTRAFKRRVPVTDVQQLRDAVGRAFSMPVARGSRPVFTAGCMERTGLPLDLAIEGEGFFAVTTLDGSTAYTRDGHLRIDNNGKLLTADGMIVLPEITLPKDTLKVTIEPEGHVTGTTAGCPDCVTQFGRLNLHRFMAPEEMQPIGAHWRATDESGQPITGTPGTIGLGLLEQGFIERSNVLPEQELEELQALERERAVLLGTMREGGYRGR